MPASILPEKTGKPAGFLKTGKNLKKPENLQVYSPEMDAHEIADLWQNEIQKDLSSFGMKSDNPQLIVDDEGDQTGAAPAGLRVSKSKGALLGQLAGLLETELPKTNTNEDIGAVRGGQSAVMNRMASQRKRAGIQQYVGRRTRRDWLNAKGKVRAVNALNKAGMK